MFLGRICTFLKLWSQIHKQRLKILKNLSYKSVSFLDESGPTWFTDSDWTKFTGSAPPFKQYVSWFISVAEPGCLSRIPDPDFYPSRISDPGSKNSNKREGWKKLLSYFFVITNFTKFNIILFLNAEEKNLVKFSKNYWSFYPKGFHYALKYMVWDPGSGKTYSGSRIQGSKGHRIRNTLIYVCCCRAWCVTWICLRGRITCLWFMSTASPRQTIQPWTSNPGSAARICKRLGSRFQGDQFRQPM